MTQWMTYDEAVKALTELGMPLVESLGLMQCTSTWRGFSAMICDYRAFNNETAYAIAIYSEDGERLLRRINVKQ